MGQSGRAKILICDDSFDLRIFLNLKLSKAGYDVLQAEDDGSAAFELFTDTSGSKKMSFDGIITSAEYGAVTGELQTVTLNFTTNGTVTMAV